MTCNCVQYEHVHVFYSCCSFDVNICALYTGRGYLDDQPFSAYAITIRTVPVPAYIHTCTSMNFGGGGMNFGG